MHRRILCTIFVSFLGLSPTSVQAQQDMARKLTSSKPPVYPSLARGMNLEGNVKLRVTVSAGGTAKSTEVLGGNAVFSKAAQEAVASWRWVPAPQETQIVVNLNFHP